MSRNYGNDCWTDYTDDDMLSYSTEVIAALNRLVGEKNIIGNMRISDYKSRVYFRHPRLKGYCTISFQKTDTVDKVEIEEVG